MSESLYSKAANILRPLLAQSGIGIYIDQRRVYVTEIRRHLSRFQLIKSAELEIDPSAVDIHQSSGALNETTAQTIRLAMEKAGIHPRPISAALSGRDTIVRYFEMPLLPRMEWARAVYFEAQKYTGFDIKNLYYDFQIFADRERRKMHVVFAASKKENVAQCVALYGSAKLKTAILEPVAFSLLRVFRLLGYAKLFQTQAVIDVNEDGVMHIVIAKNEKLLLTQDYMITTSAEGPALDSCITEIRLCFNYFTKNFKSDVVQKVYLFAAAGERFRGWEERLAAELDIPVERANLTPFMGQSGPVSAGLAIAAGLALSGISIPGAKKINLIPKQTAKTIEKIIPLSWHEEKKMLQKWAALECLVMIALIAGAHFFLRFSIASDKAILENLKRLQAKPLTVTDPSSSVDPLREKKTALESRANFLNFLIDNRNYLTTQLSQLVKLAPGDCYLSSLQYSDQEDTEGRSRISVKLSGWIPSDGLGNELSSVGNFVNALRADKEFMKNMDEAALSSTRKSFDRIEFSLECSKPQKAA